MFLLYFKYQASSHRQLQIYMLRKPKDSIIKNTIQLSTKENDEVAYIFEIKSITFPTTLQTQFSGVVVLSLKQVLSHKRSGKQQLIGHPINSQLISIMQLCNYAITSDLPQSRSPLALHKNTKNHG